ncbi:hypothetical protein [Methanomassiliicoccus luminyensis]|jgi:hypothetical protein|uniref:hypothetical protein n=1 Tax=Methanomassiliicoccus luminyensis TaxID=1080712 RepID=UPI00035C324F|nr:hypothetical protein [Methanomassiliicoccus luminyensis]
MKNKALFNLHGLPRVAVNDLLPTFSRLLDGSGWWNWMKGPNSELRPVGQIKRERV